VAAPSQNEQQAHSIAHLAANHKTLMQPSTPPRCLSALINLCLCSKEANMSFLLGEKTGAAISSMTRLPLLMHRKV
jgi:hypothetical protein